MTVKELIEKLHKYPEDTRVLVLVQADEFWIKYGEPEIVKTDPRMWDDPNIPEILL